MPIRFRCKSCDQVLGIADRMAGAEITCLHCGFSQIVPAQTEEAEVQARAPQPPAAGGGPSLVISEAEDVGPEPGSLGRATPSAAPAATVKAAPAASGSRAAKRESAQGVFEVQIPQADVPEPPLRAAPRVPSDMILFPRRVFYVEALLYLAVAAGAFGAGYFIGRGNAVSKENAEKKARCARQQLHADGK